jgi:hypothetical protein
MIAVPSSIVIAPVGGPHGQSSGSPPRFMQAGLKPRFRLPSVDRHPSSLGMGGAFFRAFVPAAKALPGA